MSKPTNTRSVSERQKAAFRSNSPRRRSQVIDEIWEVLEVIENALDRIEDEQTARTQRH